MNEGRSDSFPCGRPIFMGSLPMRDHHQALMEVLRRMPETPQWVRLPLNAPEGLMTQFCEGLPGLRNGPTLLIQNTCSSFEKELTEFQEEYLAVTQGGASLAGTRFAVSRHAAPGLYLFLEALEAWDPWMVQGQIIGPVTLLLGIKDQGGHCAYHDEKIRDIVVKLIAQKARWQANLLKNRGQRSIVFVHEPLLGRFESLSNAGGSAEEALSCVREVLRSIRASGCWSGLHLCDRPELGIVLESDMDVLSFDLQSPLDQRDVFQKRIANFLKRDGMLAWGIVPTEPKSLRKSEGTDLAELWIASAQGLVSEGISLTDIFSRSFITSNCGLHRIDEGLAIRAMDLTIVVSNILKGFFNNFSGANSG